MNKRLKRADKLIFKYARRAGIKRISVQREKDVYFYSGQDPVTGTRWTGGINFDKRGKVLNSFSGYTYNKKSGNENVLIAAEHAGKMATSSI